MVIRKDNSVIETNVTSHQSGSATTKKNANKAKTKAIKKKPRRAKTFTGCWTCRSRKVKCDLRRPGCNRCSKSGLTCGGYDIKLRWSNLVKFDQYGVQVSTNTKNSIVTPSNSKDEPQYQRRNIDFVKYKEEYVYHEDMDDELSTLHSPPLEKIADGKTWIIKKFGVFKGVDVDNNNNINSQQQRKKKRTVPSSNNNNSSSKKNEAVSKRIKRSSNLSTVVSSINVSGSVGPEETITPQSFRSNSPQSTTRKSCNPTNIPNNPITTVSSNNDINTPLTNFPGYENIASELREDFLLSAFASNGTMFNTPQFDGINNSGLPSITNNLNMSNNNNPGQIPFDQASNASEQSLNQLLRYLFNNSKNRSNASTPDPNSIPTSTPEESTKAEKSPVPITHHFSSKKDYIPLDDSITIDSPSKDSFMPKVIMEVVSSSTISKENRLKLLEKLKKMDPSITIPETGLMVHGLTRFLLNHYINNVADLMTVIPVEKNPWKNLYFPRAISALGDLTALGHTSNSRNSLLNALLAVSCFNLKSKFDKNSMEQNFFLNLGIEFRRQATSFLNICLNETVDKERYKDVLTAILSMNSIDVVWGTMTDCQRHLTICEDFIENRMQKRPNLSEKARTLHRIFSFLKLIQDSTALDKVREKEIVFIDKSAENSHDPSSLAAALKHAPIHAAPISSGLFRESVNEQNGKIQIEYIKDDISTPNSTGSLTPPMFSNIASMSYYSSDKKQQTSDILGTDALYGLPNSLILLFSDCVRIARHTEYYNMKYVSVPREFTDLTIKFEKRLLKWKPEWTFFKDKEEKLFINDTIEAIYHHTMSFYFGLVIYYFTMARSLSNDFLQNYVSKVLKHLKEMTRLIETKDIQLVPLIWQGFIAGCASTDDDVQKQFKEWAAKLAESGMGSYWGARQVMFEVWKRRDSDEPGDNWYSVYKDWKMNLMLS